jgi:hypothetical protein
MISTEVHTISQSSVPAPEWLRVTAAEAYSGLKKSALYELITSGAIKSFALKHDKNSLRGVRLISRTSIDAYFSAKAAEAGVEVE